MDLLYKLSNTHWTDEFSATEQQHAITVLEDGGIILFPQLDFHLNQDEKSILTWDYSKTKAKNISFKQQTGEIRGIEISEEKKQLLLSVLSRYAMASYRLVCVLFPHYQSSLLWGRTSFRPAKIENRKTSYRKDDKRLHVDAFPANPNQGKRILRVFCNINPYGEDRLWRIGEPFAEVAKQFLPAISPQFPGSAALMKFIGLTRSYRTEYDHIMLQLHNRMKENDIYQKQAKQSTIHFHPGSTWVVTTDKVSHAAMSGQYLLEQTFNLPVAAMQNPLHSPLKILESLRQRELV